MRKKIFLLLIFTLCLFWKLDVFAASIKSSEIDIYKVSDNYSHLEMPSNFKEEEKIEVIDANSTVKYYPKGHITVSDDGIVKMKPSVSTINGNKRYTYYEEDALVEIHVGSEIFQVIVHTHLYEKYYAEKVMKDYINENITSDMTDMEKMKKIMKFISMTKYSYNSSSYVGLIAGDGADCWGDTSAILYMCDLAEIKAHGRNANRDLGAGNGHRNVAAILDGKVYVVDVMSENNLPRITEIHGTHDGFSVDNFCKVIQYDGYDEVASISKNPCIDEIGKLAMFYGSHSETKIKEVHVPSTITTIGVGAFSGVPTLERVIFDDGNSNYKTIDGHVYSKDGKVLNSYLSGIKKEEFIVPQGVVRIDDYAVYSDHFLKSVTLPNGLKEIGASAFYDTPLEEIVIPASVTEIGDYAFNNTNTRLVVKSRNVKLGRGLCWIRTPISGYKGSTAEEYAKTNNCQFIEIPQSEYLKGDMDENEEIEIYDVMELLYIISEKKEKTDLAIEIGDMDDNGDLDIFDVMELLYIYTGKK